MMPFRRIINLATWIFILAVSVFTSGAFAQISKPGMPHGLQSAIKNQLSSPHIFQLQQPDLQTLLKEDEVFDTLPATPFRFGENIYTDLNTNNSGTWDYFEDGSRLWRLGVTSPGALTLNLSFNRYHLPPGASLYVYTPDGTFLIGAFTSINNQEDGYFATTLLPGDHVMLEYHEPADAPFEGELNLWRVTHGYRSPGEFLTKAFSDSGTCNVNVACSETEGWENQIRSVGMMITGGNGFCTGTLINNVNNDGKPYFLTANHCYRNPSTLVVWFNWQSETCSNPTVIPPHDAISGAVDRARNTTSDFWLIEFNQPVPEEYNVYYSGWNRTLDATLDYGVVSIHHPRGDIKKFSCSEGGAQSASYLGNAGTGTTHWRVGPWSGGTTTEPGSSGAALFDNQGRIIGQLHGGYAACGNLLSDWFGRFGISWTGGESNSTRLSNWLDPDNTDVQAIYGFDPILDLAEPSAPASVDGFTLSADATGKLQAILQWSNPITTFAGDTLFQIDSVIVLRDNVLIKSFAETVPGEFMEFTDSLMGSSGLYQYTVRAVNETGPGPIARRMLFIGPDVPAPVSGIVLQDIDNNGFLTWTPPTRGLNDGFFEPSSLTHYQIIRNPGQAVFTIPATETQFTDETIPSLGFYSYTIVAYNEAGAGGAATSELVLLASEGAIFMYNGTVTTCQGTFFDSGGPGSDYQNNENFTLTLVPAIDGAKINVRFSELNTESGYDILYVYEGNEVDDLYLVGQFSGSGVPARLTELISSHPTGAITFRFVSDGSVTRPGWSAQVTCQIPEDNDLAAIAISGNLTPSVGIGSAYNVKVNNAGFMTQEDYQVMLKTTAGDTLVIVDGLPIKPGEIIDFLLPWTPAPGFEGNVSLRGLVSLDGDVNSSNNYTGTLTVNVLPAGLQAVHIGSGTELPNYRLPFDFYWRNSLVQTLFFDNEMQIAEGMINGMALYNNFANNVMQRNIRIYLSNTELENLSEGFVPTSRDEMVFDGKIDFPAGAHAVYIPFDTLFHYKGGNLLVTTLREFEQQFFTVNEKFYISRTSHRPNRSVQFNSDVLVIDPRNPPTTGSINYRDVHPNTTFYFIHSSKPETFPVTFTVNMSRVPYLVFDPEADTLYISGTLSDWDEPDHAPEFQQLKPVEGSAGLYSNTLHLAAGEYEYIYFVNTGWDGAEWDNKPLRKLEVQGEMAVLDEFAMGIWEFGLVQIINNLHSEGYQPITVKINGKLIDKDIPFRHATPLSTVPSGRVFPLTIYIQNQELELLLTGTISSATDSIHTLVISGMSWENGFNPYVPVGVYTYFNRAVFSPEETTDILYFQGSTDMPSIEIRRKDTPDNSVQMDFGDFAGFMEAVSNDQIIEILKDGQVNIPELYLLPLRSQGWEEKMLTILLSGFYNPSNNNNGPLAGLWATTEDGGAMFPLQVVTHAESHGFYGSEISVYPNPAKDLINVSSDLIIKEIELSGLDGKTLLRETPEQTSYWFNISTLKAGLYILRVSNKVSSVTLKLIVQ